MSSVAEPNGPVGGPGDHPELVQAAQAELTAGRPIVVPTDTVYGLAVRAGDRGGLERVFELKRRPKDRSVAILVASVGQAEQLVDLNGFERRVAKAFWPGALTIVAARRPDLSASIGRDDGTVGVRAPAEPWVLELCRRVGPLATTSANRSGEPTPTQARAAADALDGSVSIVVDAGPRSGAASTVARIHADTGGPRVEIFRAGSVTEAMLVDALS